MRIALFLLGLIFCLPGVGRADEAADIADLADPDAAALRRYKVPVTPDGVLAVVKAATGADVADADISAAVAGLGAADAPARERAVKKLAAWGPAAAPALRVAAGSADAAVNKQARTLLAKLSDGAVQSLPSAARVLLRQKDAAVIEPLVKLLPFVQDPELEADLWYGFDKHVTRDPAVVKIIVGFTADPMAARRVLAAHFAAWRGGDAGKAKAAALLADPAPVVRLRAAQGLLAVRDARGVPALIDLLASDDNEMRWQAEELLRWCAPAGPPVAPIGNDAKARPAAQAAWRAWWAKAGERVDFAAADATAHRPILMLTVHRESGHINLIGSDGTIRAEWPALARLNDARYLPGGDVAAVQGSGPVNTDESRLSVSRPGGPAVWACTDLENPVSCQLLPDGRLFVPEHPRAGEKMFRFQIFSPTGRAVEHEPDWADGKSGAAAVRRMPGGRIFWRDAPARQRADEPGLKDAGIYDPFLGRLTGFPKFSAVNYRTLEIEMLPKAGFLVAGKNPVSEYDSGVLIFDGIARETWRHRSREARHAIILSSDNVLACLGDRVVELTRDHRLVGEAVLRREADTARPCLPLARLGFDTFPADRDLEFDVERRHKALGDADAAERRNALQRIADMRYNWPVQLLPDIKKRLADPDTTVRAAAEKALTAIDEAKIPKLLEQTKDADFKVRLVALHQLQYYACVPSVPDALISGLTDPHWQVRQQAAMVLGGRWSDANHTPRRSTPRFTRVVDRALPALIAAASTPLQADDPDMEAQDAAVEAIGVMGRANVKLAVTALIERGGRVPARRYRRIETVAELADASDDVLPILLREFKDLGEMRLRAAYCFMPLGLKAAPATDTLMELFRNRDKFPEPQKDVMASGALETLAAIAPDDKRVIKFLMEVLADRDMPMPHRLSAGSALNQISKHAAKAALAEVEQWPDLGRVIDSRYNQNDLMRDIRYRLAESSD